MELGEHLNTVWFDAYYIFDPASAYFRVIEPGLDRNDLIFLQTRSPIGHPGRFMDLQSESMPRAVDESYGTGFSILGSVAQVFEAPHDFAVNRLTTDSGLDLIERESVGASHGSHQFSL